MTEFKVRIKVEAPPGGRKGTVLKWIKYFMDNHPETFKEVFLVHDEREDYFLDLTYIDGVK